MLRSILDKALELHNAGDYRQAEALYQQVLQRWPGQPDALNLLGVLANQFGRPEVAIDLIGQALAKLPDEPDFHGNLAIALQVVGRVAESIVHFREAIRLKPTAVTYHVLLSEALQQQGNLDEALTWGLEALRLDPCSAQAYCILGDLAAHGRYVLTEGDIQRMQQLLDEGRQMDADAAVLCFTLAAHWERHGSYDRAFSCYYRANEYKLRVYRKDNIREAFDPAKHRDLVESLIAVFTPEFLEKARLLGIDSETPVFVVGLVRSGTSLVEQILASHPQVHGAGERKELDQVAATLHEQLSSRAGEGDNRTGAPFLPTAAYPACVQRLDAGLVRSLAYGYLQRLARHAGTASRIVDKMPHNYLHLGLISMLFPQAHIVHCRRDPMDVCASAYFQNFKWMPHAASLEDIAFHHRYYTKLMDHWRRVLPMPIHEVVYEDMVADPVAESRKLVVACGLDWDERCLAFHRTKRVVQTASKLQVRQPIYRHAVGRWKHFQAHLEPLREALGLAAKSEITEPNNSNWRDLQRESANMV
jgi:Flp pilus assembly protein TadD